MQFHKFQYPQSPFTQFNRAQYHTLLYKTTTINMINLRILSYGLTVLLSEKLRVTCHYFNSADIFLALVAFEQRIL